MSIKWLFISVIFMFSCSQIPNTAVALSESKRNNSSMVNVEILNDADYYSRTLTLIKEAKKSVHVLMYAAKYNVGYTGDMANTIIESLKAAVDRGADVKIIVDQITATSYPATTNYLISQGVPCKVEKLGTTLHAKMVLIDGMIVISGSHNWTTAALKYNHESSTILYSPEFADTQEMYYQDIWEEAL